ncbi:hypothetical protein CK203_052515 [Vitis vinifera]|uniref:Uncharacterized protein n=1 Tax=Vitis vinifera TaxID=29760 RepID=A0A438GI74_VITVI|nr:hypothetical protein CK203_052515 [Vitis vinifera]
MLTRNENYILLVIKKSTGNYDFSSLLFHLNSQAQAMKEQAQLREEMAYQYKVGNFEAAAAIQRRLDPDVAM